LSKSFRQNFNKITPVKTKSSRDNIDAITLLTYNQKHDVAGDESQPNPSRNLQIESSERKVIAMKNRTNWCTVGLMVVIALSGFLVVGGLLAGAQVIGTTLFVLAAIFVVLTIAGVCLATRN
jgi:hypothetical protein